MPPSSNPGTFLLNEELFQKFLHAELEIWNRTKHFKIEAKKSDAWPKNKNHEFQLRKHTSLYYYPFYFANFLKLGFTPCNAEQPLQGIGLQEKEAQKD